MQRRAVFLHLGVLLLSLLSGTAYASQTGTRYTVPLDVLDSGGADVSKSSNYLLSDSIGEPLVGYGSSDDYVLNSGYRQPSASDYISIGCTSFVNLGSVPATGQKTGSGVCRVYTDAYNGYRLIWKAGSNNAFGLVGHWKFDEPSGTTAYDSSGNGYDGTLTNGPTNINAVPSRFFSTRSISFDATDDFVSSALTLPQDENTMSFWIYLNSSSSKSFGQAIAWSYPTYTPHFMLLEKSGNLRSYNYNRVNTSDIGSGTNYSTLGSLSTGQWTHVAVVHKDGQEVAYINGIRGAPVSYSSTGGANGQVRLSWSYWGVANGNQDYLDGRMDDVRIFNRGLTTEEIQDLASLAPPGSLTASGSQTSYIPGIFFPSTGGLVGHWKLDEFLAGSTAADSSGYNSDGSLAGAGGSNNLPQPTTNVPTNANVQTLRSLNFDGTDDAVSIADTTILKPSQITVSAWIYPNNFTSDWDTVLMKTTASSWTDGYGLAHYNTANSIAFFINSWSANRAISTLTPDGAWHHVAGTYDLQNIKLYIDGSLVATTPYTTAITNSTQPLLIGKGGGGAYQFDGSIDDVRVYSRALSAAEIKGLAGVPQTWSVAATEAAWGGRLSSDSTDTDSKWGTDGGSEKWLNIGDGFYTAVRRSSATTLSGSAEQFEYRAEIGSSKLQETGTYRGVVTFTVVGY